MKLDLLRFKQRQLNKFNNLLNKKEGNITRANSLISTNLASQIGRQASTLLPPREGSNLEAQATQSGRQTGAHLPQGEGSSVSQAGSQASQVVTPQPGALLPPREGSIFQAGGQASQAVTSQPGAHLPSGEGSSLVASQASQVAGRPVTSPSPEEGGSLATSQASPGRHSTFPCWGKLFPSRSVGESSN